MSDRTDRTDSFNTSGELRRECRKAAHYLAIILPWPFEMRIVLLYLTILALVKLLVWTLLSCVLRIDLLSWFECGINMVKPRFLFKTVDIWAYILPIDRY